MSLFGFVMARLASACLYISYVTLTALNLLLLHVLPDEACPALAKVPHVLVLHGQSDGSLELMKVL